MSLHVHCRIMKNKLVYVFSKNQCEGHSGMHAILGRKGANLAEMSLMGLPVPPGFTISTVACKMYLETGSLNEDILEQIRIGIKFIEDSTGFCFGNPDRPLLISVRSGSPVSMPGMMDTILNIGINDQTFTGLVKLGGEKFARDTYARLIKMYSSTVFKISPHTFDEVVETQKAEHFIEHNSELSNGCLLEILEKYKKIVKASTGKNFPQNVHDQLYDAVSCVFKSCNNQRAMEYKKIHNMEDFGGTAVNVQTMVFGNIDRYSATGVAFTRNPSTGEKKTWGEFLLCAQGEDIVSGTSTPMPLNGAANSMETIMPDLYKEFECICGTLERHYKDVQDVEFTIQSRKLWILQTRSAKRSVEASVKTSVDMEHEGLISIEEALKRISPEMISRILHPVISDTAKFSVLTRGLPASPGAVSGRIAFNITDISTINAQGFSAILVRPETSPEDIKSMHMSAGIVTAKGGMTSHAAVVARGMGKPCICGVSSIEIAKNEEFFLIDNKVRINKNDQITINGTTGEMILGVAETVPSAVDENFSKLMSWSSAAQQISIKANADTPEDAITASKFKADGIGLCRTEHMFFNDNRITTVQRMIMAESNEERRDALADLQIMQKQDFKDIFGIMLGQPVTVRLLDLPLHEFLPKTEEAISNIAGLLNKSISYAHSILHRLTETNPMLGHRGCRLAISYPEIYETQVHAIMSACAELSEETGQQCKPEIMIPLIMNKNEVTYLKSIIDNIAKQYSIKYEIGAMIELPRAALTIDEFASYLDFISFGTNDMTQTTLGISRDDSHLFLGHYKKIGIISDDPFETLDKAVCLLLKNAIQLAKSVNPNIKVGICGEHGGDIKSLSWCIENSIDYASCSPYRIPTAKIAVIKRNSGVITAPTEGVAF